MGPGRAAIHGLVQISLATACPVEVSHVDGVRIGRFQRHHGRAFGPKAGIDPVCSSIPGYEYGAVAVVRVRRGVDYAAVDQDGADPTVPGGPGELELSGTGPARSAV